MEEIMKKLDEKLNPKQVKTRSHSGKTLSYIEGYQAEKTANRIFQYQWDKDLISQDKLFERAYVKDGKDMFEVAYKATVRVYVSIENIKYYRDGTGAGNGISSILFGAYELAIKESETDAMKRALKSLGNQFGIELYDKAYSASSEYESGIKLSLDIVEAKEKLANCKTKLDVREVYKNYNGDYQKEFEKLCMERKKEL